MIRNEKVQHSFGFILAFSQTPNWNFRLANFMNDIIFSVYLFIMS